MKILIVSGFLGAGKTTFIQNLIDRTGKRFVILENEYGQTDIDEQVLSTEDEADVWDLTEGCICCTKSAELTSSVMTIESVLAPEFLIVEPSGVAALSNVLRMLGKIEYERITLLRPLTIIDAGNFAHDFHAFPDVYQDQLKATGTVVISKPDHPDPDVIDSISQAVAGLNPNAAFIPHHYRQLEQTWWDSLLTTTLDGKIIDSVDDAQLDLESFAMNDCHVHNPAEMTMIVQRALAGEFGYVQRAKGIVPAKDQWIRFDIVGTNGMVTGFPDDKAPKKSESVWIGNALDRFKLMECMHVPETRSGKHACCACGHPGE